MGPIKIPGLDLLTDPKGPLHTLAGVGTVLAKSLDAHSKALHDHADSNRRLAEATRAAGAGAAAGRGRGW